MTVYIYRIELRNGSQQHFDDEYFRVELEKPDKWQAYMMAVNRGNELIKRDRAAYIEPVLVNVPKEV